MMMPLSLFECFGARIGTPVRKKVRGVRKKVCGVRKKLFSHPLSPLTLPSTVCEAGANEGACVRKKFRLVRIELSRTELLVS